VVDSRGMMAPTTGGRENCYTAATPNCCGLVRSEGSAHGHRLVTLATTGRCSRGKTPATRNSRRRQTSVIFLHRLGGPVHGMRLIRSPRLVQWDGPGRFGEFHNGIQFGFSKGTARPHGAGPNASQDGQCGMEMSEQFPYLGSMRTEITVVAEW